MCRDDVDDIVILFDPAAHFHQAGAHPHLALFFHHVWPDHNVDDAGFVFQRDEAHAFGAARSLADQNHPGEMDHRASLARAQVAGANKTALSQ